MELKLQNNINMNYNYTISPSPSIGDKIQVKTSLGSKLCVIDKITDNKINVKNNSFGLEVNSERIQYQSKGWRGANFYYQSFN